MKHSLSTALRLLSVAGFLVVVPSRAGAAGFDALKFELRLSGAAQIQPLQSVAVEMLLENPAAQPVGGVPRLIPSYDGPKFLLRRGEREISVGKPLLNLANEEGTPAFRAFAAGQKDRAVFALAYDWSAKTFLFREPGAYELRAVLRSEDGAHSRTTAPVRLVVESPAPERQTEIDQLVATDAYQYVFAPEGIALDRDGDAKLAKLLAFQTRHPASPYGADIPFVAATLHEYRALVTHKSDRVRAEEHRTAQKSALLNYVRQPAGLYRDKARSTLKQQFGLSDAVE